MKENDTKKNGVTYDTKVYTITVTVDRDSSGNLTAVMAGDSTTGTDLNFENVYKVGSLTISKTVTGNLGDKNQYFPFTITFGDSGSYSYDGSSSGTITSGGTIQLKHGQSITIKDLPAGINYLVAETNYSGYTMTSTGDSGTITADQTVKASFTNNKSSGPSTGDQNDPLFWAGMLVTSMAGALGTMLTGKKKRRHNDR